LNLPPAGPSQRASKPSDTAARGRAPRVTRCRRPWPGRRP